jgi:hypothetical protein
MPGEWMLELHDAPIARANQAIVQRIASVLRVLSVTPVAACAIAGFISRHLRSLPGLVALVERCRAEGIEIPFPAPVKP